MPFPRLVLIPAIVLSAGLPALTPARLAAQAVSAPAPTAASDSSAVVGVVTRFHALLERGDSAGALALLAPEARILEGGAVETRAEYASHHLASDMASAKALEGSHTVRQVSIAGDAAWVVASYTSRGPWRGRTLDMEGAELMVLRREGTSWRIAAIHWSSRRRSTG